MHMIKIISKNIKNNIMKNITQILPIICVYFSYCCIYQYINILYIFIIAISVITVSVNVDLYVLRVASKPL